MRWFQKCFVVAEVRQYKLFSFWVFYTNISYIRNLIGQFKRDNMHNSKIKCFSKCSCFPIENSVSVSGGYMGYKASLKVDRKKFRESMSESTKVGQHKVVFTSGGPDMPETI